MSKDFDDFVIGIENDPEQERLVENLLSETVRLAEKNVDDGSLIEAFLRYADDIALIRIRAYHEWLHSS